VASALLLRSMIHFSVSKVRIRRLIPQRWSLRCGPDRIALWTYPMRCVWSCPGADPQTCSRCWLSMALNCYRVEMRCCARVLGGFAGLFRDVLSLEVLVCSSLYISQDRGRVIGSFDELKARDVVRINGRHASDALPRCRLVVTDLSRFRRFADEPGV
jgi:hypothetical protein